MEKLCRWIAKHQTASKVINIFFWGFLCGSSAVFLREHGLSAWIPYPFAVILGSICVTCIVNAGFVLQKKPLEQLKNQCDPYPFLEEINVQREYPGSDVTKQIRDINYSMALRCIGEYDLAYGLMSAINIDKNAGMLPAVKATYYNNLMDLCQLMGKNQEAVIWYNKSVQLFNDMKPGKQKEKLRNAIETNRAACHFCNGEYEMTLRCLGQAKPENMNERIENAMLYGRTYLAMDERSRAVKPLRFVAENGNKLYFATEARELLAKINTEETEL